MLLYYLKCRKNKKSKNTKITRIKTGRIMHSSKCAVCDSEKAKFIKQQLFRKKTPFSKMPLSGPLLC